MTAKLIEKLHPARFSEMSPLMAAIVGYVLGESFMKPTIAELTVSEQENLVYIRQEGAAGFEASRVSKTHGTTGIDFWMWQGSRTRRGWRP